MCVCVCLVVQILHQSTLPNPQTAAARAERECKCNPRDDGSKDRTNSLNRKDSSPPTSLAVLHYLDTIRPLQDALDLVDDIFLACAGSADNDDNLSPFSSTISTACGLLSWGGNDTDGESSSMATNMA